MIKIKELFSKRRTWAIVGAGVGAAATGDTTTALTYLVQLIAGAF